ncbi:MAG: histidine phosphatase family protein [Chitinophagaceae bacterium]
MLNVYFMRHGQTQWNAEGNRYCGRTDLPLTDLGIQQAHLVHKQMQKISLAAVYSSPLQRAWKTAQIAGSPTEIVLDDRLIEADFGDWESKPKEVFIKENEEIWNNWCADPLKTKAGRTGETANEVIRRVDDFFNSVLRQHKTGNILVVAHNAVNRFYLAYKLGMNVKDYRKLYLDNSTISMFQLDEDGELTLVHLNSKL